MITDTSGQAEKEQILWTRYHAKLASKATCITILIFSTLF